MTTRTKPPKPSPRRLNIDWPALRSRLGVETDEALAAELGCSSESVRKARKRLGIKGGVGRPKTRTLPVTPEDDPKPDPTTGDPVAIAEWELRQASRAVDAAVQDGNATGAAALMVQRRLIAKGLEGLRASAAARAKGNAHAKTRAQKIAVLVEAISGFGERDVVEIEAACARRLKAIRGGS